MYPADAIMTVTYAKKGKDSKRARKECISRLRRRELRRKECLPYIWSEDDTISQR